MDKLRAFLKATWRQRFWVLTVVCPLLALVCWLLASGSLQKAFLANKGTIEGHFTAMSNISKEPVHGNDGVNSQEIVEADKVSKAVRKLWQRMYDAQREEVLKWPERLGVDFLSYIETRKFGDPIPSSAMRTRYLDYIKGRFDALVKMVQAKNLMVEATPAVGVGVGPESRGAYGAGMLYGEVRDYLVDWLDQDQLNTKLTFARQPTAMQIWVTQEDLWVYETLLTVINRTNKARGATAAADNAAIRVISTLEVGSRAAVAMSKAGNIIVPAADVVAGEFAEGGGPIGPPTGGVDEYGTTGEVDPAAADAAFTANRYVGADGQPLPDITSGTGVEYRRLPIQMVLTMDQRWITPLLVECANATLPIEVQRLRINPEKSSIEGGAAGGEMPSMMAPGGGRPGELGAPRSGYGGYARSGGIGRPGESRGEGMGSAMAAMAPTGLGPDYVTVELQGLVYIYNEPNDVELTVPGAEQLVAVEGAPAAADDEAPAADDAAPAADETDPAVEDPAPATEEPAPADDGSVATAGP